MDGRARDERERLAALAQLVVREPNSIPRRLDLAMALLDVGRRSEAIALFRDIALAYADGGQLVQAMAVCRGILEIDAAHEETLELLGRLVERRGGRPGPRLSDPDDEEPTLVESSEPPEAAGPPRVAVPLDPDRDERIVTTRDLTAFAGQKDEGELEEGHDEEETTSPGDKPHGVSGEEAPADEVAEALLRSAREREAIDSLPAFPLFSDLPQAAFRDLLRDLRVVDKAADEAILIEGSEGDAFYLIAEGTVRVKKVGVEVARLGPGSFFGEFAVLSDQRRHATVESVGNVRLLEISRPLLDHLVAEHPGVARTLRAFYADRLLATLLQTAPFFGGLSPEERAAVATRFRPRRFGRGATIIEEGSAGGGLYLILVGEVEVVRNDAAGSVELGRLGEGCYFGEMSLLKGSNASATVRASRLCETVQLPPRDFYEIVSKHPVLWDQLRMEAQRRELTNVAILAGEAHADEDGQVYLV